MDLEIWKQVVGWENFYSVSSFGRVRNDRTGKILRSSTDRYASVHLSANGKSNRVSVHRLVMRAFHGDSHLDVNHVDGDKLNNKLSNLEYVTRSGNLKHAFRTGLASNVGSKHSRAKLTERDVILIRKLSDHLLPKTIAEVFGVKSVTVRDIVRGNRWTHVS